MFSNEKNTFQKERSLWLGRLMIPKQNWIRKDRVGFFMYLEKLTLVYICKMYVLIFVLHFKCWRGCKCSVICLSDDFTFIVRVTVSHLTERITTVSIFKVMAHVKKKSFSSGTANKDWRQRLSLDHMICFLSVGVWNISCWEGAGLFLMDIGSSWVGFPYRILCNRTMLNVIQWCQGNKWPREDWINSEVAK